MVITDIFFHCKGCVARRTNPQCAHGVAGWKHFFLCVAHRLHGKSFRLRCKMTSGVVDTLCKWKHKGARILFTLPTGQLASEVRSVHPDIDVDTSHGAFLLHRPLQEAMAILTQYELVIIDEASTRWNFRIPQNQICVINCCSKRLLSLPVCDSNNRIQLTPIVKPNSNNYSCKNTCI